MSDKTKKVLYWIAGVAVAVAAGVTALFSYFEKPATVDPVAVVDTAEVSADTLVTAPIDTVAE